ncbi:hypothetical protein [Streptomyces sp. NBC_00316]|uniref:hypothetical protein n=1 Tax=Streptomyces sp. NBC_00316 TaxID=2975710 RepID=UPI002E287B2E|nr:hypothetical protein [Streptomyces sp. NBC_00316]
MADITLDIKFNRSETCSPQQGDSSLSWFPGYVHIAAAMREHSWNNYLSAKGRQIPDLHPDDQPHSIAGPCAGPRSGAISPSKSPRAAGPGNYQPTHHFDSAKYPTAAAHVWLMHNPTTRRSAIRR